MSFIKIKTLLAETQLKTLCHAVNLIENPFEYSVIEIVTDFGVAEMKEVPTEVKVKESSLPESLFEQMGLDVDTAVTILLKLTLCNKELSVHCNR